MIGKYYVMRNKDFKEMYWASEYGWADQTVMDIFHFTETNKDFADSIGGEFVSYEYEKVPYQNWEF